MNRVRLFGTIVSQVGTITSVAVMIVAVCETINWWCICREIRKEERK